MRGILVGIMMAAVAVSAVAETADREVIAQDTAGLIVMVKEQYGGYVVDTCTVVMMYQGNFVLVHRKSGASWYPVAFNSINIVERLSAKATVGGEDGRLAGSEATLGMASGIGRGE